MWTYKRHADFLMLSSLQSGLCKSSVLSILVTLRGTLYTCYLIVKDAIGGIDGPVCVRYFTHANPGWAILTSMDAPAINVSAVIQIVVIHQILQCAD